MKKAHQHTQSPIFETEFNQSFPGGGKSKFAMTGLAGAIITALYPVSPAVAQDADEEFAMEEVLVTATKREMNLQDVPQSITAFTTIDIEKNAFKSMADYVRALPSVQLINAEPGRNELFFRGISTGSGEYRTDAQAAVYLDEQPLTTNSQQVSPWMVDIDHVESLPGPQGTLFGSSSQTGTIRIITNKPTTDAFSGQVFAEARWTDGGEPGYELNGHLNIPMGDKAALRLVGYGNIDGGWVDNVFGEDLVGLTDNADVVEDDFNDWEIYGGRAALKLELSDNLDILAAFITENSETNGTSTVDPLFGDDKITRFFDEYRTDDWWQAALTITADVGFADLVSNTAYFDREMAYEWDNMNYEQWKDSYWGNYWDLGLYDSEYTFGTVFNDQHQDRFSQEIRLTSNNDSKFAWMAGFFFEEVYDEWYYGTLNPDLMSTRAWYTAQAYAYYYSYYYDVEYPLPPTTVGYSNTFRRTIKQTAFFGEISYELTDDWSATFGARWFEYDRDEFDQFQFPEGLAPVGGHDTDGIYVATGKEGDTVFKFSTQYNLSDDKMVYLLFSQGFRLGGFNSQRAAATGLVPLRYDPDHMNNYETGIKSTWLDGRLVFNANLFLMKWKDIQLNNEGGVDSQWWLRGTLNGETGEQKGLELNFNWAITDNLLFTGSATFTDPEYTKEFTRVDGTVVPAGTTMPISPEQVFWGAIEYNFSNWQPFGGKLWLRYDQNYQSSKYNSLDSAIFESPEGLMPSWSIANFQAGLNLRNGWTTTFFIRNIWNEKAMSWLNSGSDYQSNWFGDPRWKNNRSYQRPRTIGLNVRKSF